MDTNDRANCFGSDQLDRQCEPRITTDKDRPIRTFLHYSDPRAREEITVFGEKKDGLFYNYNDRLAGNRWNEGLDIAGKQLDPPAYSRTARYFEIALNHFHETDTVDLQHIVLGCNASNGFSYLAFGYTYETTPPETAEGELR